MIVSTSYNSVKDEHIAQCGSGVIFPINKLTLAPPSLPLILQKCNFSL